MTENVKGNLESETVVQTILFQYSLPINLKHNNCFGTPWWQSLRECRKFSQYLQFCNLFDWDNVCCTCSSMKTFCLQHINKKKIKLKPAWLVHNCHLRDLLTPWYKHTCVNMNFGYWREKLFSHQINVSCKRML